MRAFSLIMLLTFQRSIHLTARDFNFFGVSSFSSYYCRATTCSMLGEYSETTEIHTAVRRVYLNNYTRFVHNKSKLPVHIMRYISVVI